MRNTMVDEMDPNEQEVREAFETIKRILNYPQEWWDRLPPDTAERYNLLLDQAAELISRWRSEREA
jgi:hypothetical protein